jgi:beta-mannosidase
LQADGITLAIEAHRRAKPYCMGTLYWQLNDCWPVISWSGIDYDGNWKALHHHVKKAYEDILISITRDEDLLTVHAISDLMKDKRIEAELNLMDFNGNTSWTKTMETMVWANESKVIYQTPISGLISGNDPRNIFLLIHYHADETEGQAFYYFEKPKDLVLLEPGITCAVKEDGDDFHISITSKHLARFVRISSDTPGHFSDNYFDLVPGRPLVIFFSPDISQENEPDFEVISLFDIFQKK